MRTTHVQKDPYPQLSRKGDIIKRGTMCVLLVVLDLIKHASCELSAGFYWRPVALTPIKQKMAGIARIARVSLSFAFPARGQFNGKAKVDEKSTVKYRRVRPAVGVISPIQFCTPTSTPDE